METGLISPLSVADYLAFEETSDTCHEYLDGVLREREGSTCVHNTINGNIAATLLTRLRAAGTPGRIFAFNYKVHLTLGQGEFFYYPDVVVTNHPKSIELYFLNRPTLIVEVLSPSTETIDRREKKMNYLQVQTLEEYILIAQDRRELTIFRRSTGWVGEIFTAPESLVEFLSIKQAMTLAEIYEDVAF